ncbi:MAG: ATP-binding protein, partial [Brevundimonas sp.]
AWSRRRQPPLTSVLSIALDPVLVLAADAAAVATIAAELLGNAFEHGLGDHDGEIALSLDAVGDGWRLSIADDGPGLPERAIAAPGFGLVLVARLARQLHAILDRQSDGHGVRYTLSNGAEPVRALS